LALQLEPHAILRLGGFGRNGLASNHLGRDDLGRDDLRRQVAADAR
jgi:hypothetical protein